VLSWVCNAVKQESEIEQAQRLRINDDTLFLRSLFVFFPSEIAIPFSVLLLKLLPETGLHIAVYNLVL
jgi:hypothetical protein